MLFARSLRRSISGVTKGYRSLRARIANPAPLYAAEPVRLCDGSLFVDLVAKKPRQILSPEYNPPLIANRNGTLMMFEEKAEMRQLRKADPQRWTVGALALRFKCSRGFVSSVVLTLAEKEAERAAFQERWDKMSLSMKRGWLLREMLRKERRRAW